VIDPFAELGLPRAQAIDPDDLDRRLRERARAVHPDRFARAPAPERLRAADASARLHAAHRTLRDPLARAGALLALAGRDLAALARARPEPAFLEAQLEAREALAAATAAGDPAAAAVVRERAREALAACEARLAALLVPGAAPEALATAERELVSARFHASLAAAAAGAM
jgi:molecular chaperone HscB